MSEGPNPTTWQTFVPWGIWGGLIFSCLMVFVEDLVDGKPYQAISALGLGLVTAAMAIHWKAISPKFGVPVIVLLLLVIVMSPYVEQRRWPYAWLVDQMQKSHDVNDPQAVAKAVVTAISPIIASTNRPQPAINAHDVASEVIRLLPAQSQGQPSGVPVAETANAIAHALSSQHSLISLQDYEVMKAQLSSLAQENERLKRVGANAADGPPTPMFGFTNAKRWKIITTFSDATATFLQNAQRCRMMIEEIPNSPSANQFWIEMTPIFQYSGWQIEGFGQQRKFFPKGVTINVNGDKGIPYMCGWQLHELLESLNVEPINFQSNQNTPALAYCAQCVDVVLGDVTVH